MRIALAQINVASDKAANLRKIESLIIEGSSHRADLVVFPEASMHASGADGTAAGAAEPLNGPFITTIMDLAKRYRIAVVCGVLESSPDPARAYNSVAVIDNTGNFVDAYRKIHLFDAFGKQESKMFLPGDGQTLLFDCADMTLGVMTCYDVRFPELARHLAYQGARALVLPAAWYAGPLKEMHLEVLCRARAIENNCYVAVSVQVGENFCGNGMVIDPMGVIQASRGELEGLLFSEMLPERVDSVRTVSPTLKNSRSDVYSRWRETKWYEEHSS